jgi:hypothetical protein
VQKQPVSTGWPGPNIIKKMITIYALKLCNLEIVFIHVTELTKQKLKLIKIHQFIETQNEVLSSTWVKHLPLNQWLLQISYLLHLFPLVNALYISLVQQEYLCLHYILNLKIHPSVQLNHRYTNPGHQVAQATELCSVVPRICMSSVCSFLHVMFLAPNIFRWLLDIFKICGPLWRPDFLKISRPLCWNLQKNYKENKLLCNWAQRSHRVAVWWLEVLGVILAFLLKTLLSRVAWPRT